MKVSALLVILPIVICALVAQTSAANVRYKRSLLSNIDAAVNTISGASQTAGKALEGIQCASHDRVISLETTIEKLQQDLQAATNETNSKLEADIRETKLVLQNKADEIRDLLAAGFGIGKQSGYGIVLADLKQKKEEILSELLASKEFLKNAPSKNETENAIALWEFLLDKFLLSSKNKAAELAEQIRIDWESLANISRNKLASAQQKVDELKQKLEAAAEDEKAEIGNELNEAEEALEAAIAEDTENKDSKADLDADIAAKIQQINLSLQAAARLKQQWKDAADEDKADIEADLRVELDNLYTGLFDLFSRAEQVKGKEITALQQIALNLYQKLGISLQTIGELREQMENASDYVKSKIEYALKEAQGAFKQQLIDLKLNAEALAQAKIGALERSVGDLKALSDEAEETINALKQELQTAVGQKRADIEAALSSAKAYSKKLLAALAAKSAELEEWKMAVLQGIVADLKTKSDEAKQNVDSLIENLQTAAKDKKAEIQQDLNEAQANLENLLADYKSKAEELEGIQKDALERIVAELKAKADEARQNIVELIRKQRDAAEDKKVEIEQDLNVARANLEGVLVALGIKAGELEQIQSIALENIIADLKAKSDEAKENVAGLREQLKNTLKDNKEEIQLALDDAKANLKNLQAALRTKAAKLEAIKIAALERSTADLKAVADKQRLNIMRLIEKLRDAAGDKKEEIQQALNGARANLESILSTLKENGAELVERKTAALQNTIADLRAKSEEATQKVAGILGKLKDAAEDKKEKILQTLSEAQSNAENILGDLKAKSEELEQLKKTALETSVADLRAASEAARQNVAGLIEGLRNAAENKKGEIQQALSDAWANSENISAALKSKDKELENLNNSALERAISYLRAKAEEAKLNVAVLKEILKNAAEDQKEQIQQALNVANSNVENIKAALQSKTEELEAATEAALEKIIADLNALADAAKGNVAALSESLRTASLDKKAEIQQALNNEKSNLENIQAALGAKATELEAIKIAALERSTADLKALADKERLNIWGLIEKLRDTAGDKKEEIQQALNGARANWKNLQEALRAKTSELEAIEIAALERSIAELKAKSDKAKENLAGLIEQLKNAPEGKKQEIQHALSGARANLESIIAAIGAKAAELEERKIIALQNNVHELKAKSGEAAQKVAGLIENLKDAVEDKKDEIQQALNEAKWNAENILTALKSKTTELEAAKKTALEKTIGDLKALYDLEKENVAELVESLVTVSANEKEDIQQAINNAKSNAENILAAIRDKVEEAALEKVIAVLKDKSDAAKETVAALIEEWKSAANDRKLEIQEGLNYAKSNAESLLAALKARASELEAIKTAALEKITINLKAKSEELKHNLATLIENWRTAVDDKKGELQHAIDEAKTNLENILDVWRAKAAELEARKNAALERVTSDLKAKSEELKQLIVDLTEQLHAAAEDKKQQILDALNNAKAALESNAEELERVKNIALESVLADLKAKSEAIKQEIASLAERLRTASNDQKGDIQISLNDAKLRLEAILSTWKAKAAELEGAKNAVLEPIAADLRAELEELNQKIATITLELSAAADDKKEEIQNALNDAKSEQKAKAEELQNAINAALEISIANLNAKSEELKLRIAQLIAQLENADEGQKDEIQNVLSEARFNLQIILTALKDKAAELEDGKIAALRIIIDDLKSKSDELKLNIARLGEQLINAAGDKKQTIQDAIYVAQSNLVEIQAALEAKSIELEQREISASERVIWDLKLKSDELKQLVATLTVQLKTVPNDKKLEIQNALNNAQLDLETASAAWKAKVAELEQKQTAVLERIIADLKAKSDELIQRVSTLTEQLKTANGDQKEQIQNDLLNAKINLDTNVAAWRKKAAELEEAKNAALGEVVADLTAKSDELKRLVASLSEQLKTAAGNKKATIQIALDEAASNLGNIQAILKTKSAELEESLNASLQKIAADITATSKETQQKVAELTNELKTAGAGTKLEILNAINYIQFNSESTLATLRQKGEQLRNRRKALLEAQEATLKVQINETLQNIANLKVSLKLVSVDKIQNIQASIKAAAAELAALQAQLAKVQASLNITI